MKNEEKELKRWLKRKMSFTLSLLVIFLITGMVGYAADSTSYTAGTNAKVEGSNKNGVAIGKNAIVKDNSDYGIALGVNSVANRAKGTAGYDPLTGKASTEESNTWKATYGALSIGAMKQNVGFVPTVDDWDVEEIDLEMRSMPDTHVRSRRSAPEGTETATAENTNKPEFENTRQIVGVAAGTNDTDAANVAQLKRLRTYVDNKSAKYYGVSSESDENINGEQALGRDVVVIGPGNTMPTDIDGNVVKSYNTTVIGSNNAVLEVKKDQKTELWSLGGHTISNTIVGQKNKSLGYTNIIVGDENKAFGKDAVNIGSITETRGQNAISIGNYAKAKGDDAIAQGFGSKAGYSSIAIGRASEAQAGYSVSIGEGAVSKVNTGVAIGTDSLADRKSKVYGFVPDASKELKTDEDIAEYLGKLDKYKELKSRLDSYTGLKSKHDEFETAVLERAKVEEKIEEEKTKMFDAKTKEERQKVLDELNKLQKEYDTKRADELVKQDAYLKDPKYAEYKKDSSEMSELLSTMRSSYGAVSVGNKEKGIKRQITNVAGGTEDSDAVNVAQLKNLKSYVDNKSIKYYGVSSKSDKNINGEQALGRDVVVIGPGNEMPTDVKGDLQPNRDTTVLGTNNNIKYVKYDKYDGSAKMAGDVYSTTVVGNKNKLTEPVATVVGSDNTVTAREAVVVGNNIKTTPDARSAVSIGFYSSVQGYAPVALGDYAHAHAGYAIAIGKSAESNASRSISLGALSKADASGGVALGWNSSADVKAGKYAYAPDAKKPLATEEDIAEYLGKLTEYKDLKAKIEAASDVKALEDEADKALFAYMEVGKQIDLERAKIADAKTPAERQDILDKIKELAKDHQAKKKDYDTKSQAYNNNPKKKQYEKDKDALSELLSVMRSSAGAVSVGNTEKGIKRQITNVAGGTEDSDAVNIAQLKKLKSYVDDKSAKYYGVSSKSYKNKYGEEAIGTDTVVIGPGNELSINEKSKKLGGENTTVLGSNNRLENVNTAFSYDMYGANRGGTVVGSKNLSASNNTVILGYDNKAYDESDIVIGNQSEASGERSLAIGNQSKAMGRDAVAAGYATKSGFESVAIGGNAKSEVKGGTSIGRAASVVVDGGVALGSLSESTRSDIGTFGYIPTLNKIVSGEAEIAEILGKKAEYDKIKARLDASPINAKKTEYEKASKAFEESKAKLAAAKYKIKDAKTAEERKALLEELKTLREDYGKKLEDVNSKSYKSGEEYKKYMEDKEAINNLLAAYTANEGAVSVGSKRLGIQRQITNVAAGFADTDAVNVAQLKGAVKLTNNLQKATGLTDDEIAKINDPNEKNKPKTLVERIEELSDAVGTDGKSGLNGKVGDPGKDGKDGRNGTNGLDGTAAADGKAGPAGKDGLNGQDLNSKVNALRRGEAGTVVYTDAEGNRLVKAEDGKMYLADQVNPDGKLKDTATATPIKPENIRLSTVNADGTTTVPTQLGNIAAGTKDTDAVNVKQLNDTVNAVVKKGTTGNSDLYEDEKDANGNKIDKDGNPINDKGQIIDPKTKEPKNPNDKGGREPARVLKGLKFVGNVNTGEYKKTLGEEVKILGNTNVEESKRTDYSVTNVLTENTKEGLLIKMSDKPLFKEVVVKGEEKGPSTTITPGDVTVSNGKDGKDGKSSSFNPEGFTVKDGKDGENGKAVYGKDGISITGPKGENGADGKTTTIKVDKDGDVVIGKDGKDGADGKVITKSDLDKVIEASSRVDEYNSNRISEVEKRVNQVEKDSRRGTAHALAQGGVKFQEIGVNEIAVGAALGYYKGERAIAVGVQGAPSQNTRVHGTVSLIPGSQTEAGVSIGASWKFNFK